MYESIQQLVADVNKCRKCHLCEEANNAVPGAGNVKAKVLFIGEAPGKEEDKKGEPFVGAAGKFLNTMFEGAGMKRGDVYITNVVKHRPPGNRDPLDEEIAACYPYLVEQIKLIDPELIVTLGRHAMNRFMPGLKISEVHGEVQRGKVIHREKQIYFPMYHPASALYNPALRATLIADMKKVPILLEKLAHES